MKVIAFRHGRSSANGDPVAADSPEGPAGQDPPAFNNPGASLAGEGPQQAHEIGEVLRSQYNINTECTLVAVSTLERTRQTAIGAGFMPWNLRTRAELDEEVIHVTARELFRIITGDAPLPHKVYERAERICANPPPEGLWSTSGLVMAGMGEVLGMDMRQYRRFVPLCGEVRQLDLEIPDIVVPLHDIPQAASFWYNRLQRNGNTKAFPPR